MKQKWGTFTKIWFGLSIISGVIGLLSVGGVLISMISSRGNIDVDPSLYNKVFLIMSAAVVIVSLGLAATIWLMKSKSPKALYSVVGLDILNVIISLFNGQIPQAIGGIVGTVIIWLLCRKVVFDE